MTLNIEAPEADRLAQDLARLTGESVGEAVTVALRERLDREARKRGVRRDVAAALAPIRARLRRAPVLDARPVDEIVGYSPDGLPE